MFRFEWYAFFLCGKIYKTGGGCSVEGFVRHVPVDHAAVRRDVGEPQTLERPGGKGRDGLDVDRPRQNRDPGRGIF